MSTIECSYESANSSVDDDSKDIAGPILAKFRPGFVEQQKSIKEAGES